MTITRTLVCAGAALGIAASGSAFAQERLSQDEVRSFLQAASADIQQILQARELPQILDWTRQNIAETARFSVTSTLEAEGERKMFTTVHLDKDDLVLLQRMALSAMYADPAAQLADVTFEIEVVEVQPIGADTAIARTRIIEGATIERAPEAEVAEAPADVDVTGALQGARIESVSMCEHVIQRAPDAERLQIGMTTCDARMEMAIGG